MLTRTKGFTSPAYSSEAAPGNGCAWEEDAEVKGEGFFHPVPSLAPYPSPYFCPAHTFRA